MKNIVIDSNVFIASLVQKDEFHKKSIKIFEKMQKNDVIFHISTIVPIEIGCTIARRIGIGESNESIKILESWIEEKKIKIYELNKKRMKKAQQHGIKFKLRGMDAIIVQLAMELNIPLLTFDNEIIERAKEVQFY